MGDMRGAHRVSAGKPDGKNPIVGPRLGWEDNIKLDLRKLNVGYGLD
jgi:hypothetical protein